jgi:hypothetical protein
MQKKLYFLNEEEKNRILNLHESRTKKQYLVNEGSLGAGDYNSNPQATKKTNDIETKLWNDRKNRAETLESKCLTLNMPYKWDNVSAEFLDMFTGGPKWSELPNILLKLKTVNDFCQLNSNIKNQKEYTDVADNFKYEKGISNWIYKNVFYPSSWKKYFEEPLKNVLKSAGMETLDSTPQEMKDIKTDDWGSFSCVLNLTNPTIEKIQGIKGTDDVWVKRTYKTNRVEYFSNKGKFFIKYPDGSYAPLGTNNFYTYYCGSDNKPYVKRVETSTGDVKVEPKVIDYSLGVGVAQPKIQPKIKDLLKKAGIEGTEINQQTINQLYNFLKN